MKKEKILTLKEIQYEEKEMLRTIVNFFEKNKFTYYVWGGTLLGTIRHHGFIPWDDDIDLAMPRPEYNRFIEYLRDHECKISEDLSVIGYELNKTGYEMLKVVNKNIEVEKDGIRDRHLWIDIFPLEGTPKNNDRYFKKAFFINKILNFKYKQRKHIKIEAATRLKGIIKNVGMFFLRIWKYEDCQEYYFKLCHKYKWEDYDYFHLLISASWPGVFPKSILVNHKYKFEDLTVNGIKDYDIVLSTYYGNYMQLPPVEKRAYHHIKAFKMVETSKVQKNKTKSNKKAKKVINKA